MCNVRSTSPCTSECDGQGDKDLFVLSARVHRGSVFGKAGWNEEEHRHVKRRAARDQVVRLPVVLPLTVAVAMGGRY